jgi:methylenetetrahydrofolate reductase (NADPH)
VNVPIVPGIMPITNYSQLQRFSDMCGAEIPRWITQRMRAHGDDADAVRKLGTEVVTTLCRRLLDGGAPGLHFYTLNRAKATEAVLKQLA